MGMFDYSRKMKKDPVAEAIKQEEKKSELQLSVQDIPEAEQPTGPVVLRQYPLDSVKASVHAGLLRVDFTDGKSETGRGFMLVKPSAVSPSFGTSGTPIEGKSDVLISRDGEKCFPYFIVKDGQPVRSEKTPDEFRSEWESARALEALSVRKSEQAETGVQNQEERSLGYD